MPVMASGMLRAVPLALKRLWEKNRKHVNKKPYSNKQTKQAQAANLFEVEVEHSCTSRSRSRSSACSRSDSGESRESVDGGEGPGEGEAADGLPVARFLVSPDSGRDIFLHRTFCSVVARDVEEDKATDDLIDRYLGDMPVSGADKETEAALLGTSRRTVSRDVLALASCVAVSCKFWVGSFLRQIKEMHEQHHLEARAIYRFLMCDETTLKSGRHKWEGEDQESPEAAGPLKMFQSELQLAVLCRDREKRWVLWTLPVVVPLQCADRSTGECTLKLWQEACEIPFFDEARDIFARAYSCRSADRAGPNICADRSQHNHELIN